MHLIFIRNISFKIENACIKKVQTGCGNMALDVNALFLGVLYTLKPQISYKNSAVP